MIYTVYHKREKYLFWEISFKKVSKKIFKLKSGLGSTTMKFLNNYRDA